ncbi:MAG: hypothetical protein JSU74_05580, partial [Candidatus Zixiibacteriota bacterium]
MNRTLLKRILMVLLFLILPVPLCASPLLPVGLPEYDFVYDRLIRSETQSYDLYDYQLGPFGDNGGNFSFGPFEYLKSAAAERMTLFSTVGEDFYSAKLTSPSGFESLRGGVAAVPLNKLFVYANFLLDERKAKDDSYTGKKWRGLAGGVEQAFASYRSRPFEVTLGRFASFWGPRNSLVLSSTNALDGFGYSFYWGRLVLTYRLARLDGLNPDEDDVDQFENRFFAGHRLDIHLSRWLRIGLFETIIFGGPGRQVDLLYLNPIVFFHADQLNEGVDDNTLIGFDYVLKPRLGVKLYGQLLIDDFQIDDRSQGDQEPNQYGIILGAQTVDLMPATDLELEYSRVANWTFNQALERNRYLFNSDLIGAATGNDYETWQLTCTRWLREYTAVSARLAYRRQGEGRV